MPKEQSLQQQIARGYVERFPKTPRASLARMIYNENVEVFKSPETARKCLLRIEGKNGIKSRESAADKTLYRETTLPFNPYGLPDSFCEDKAPFTLPKSCTNVLVISDLHMPYHDIAAVSAAMKYGKKQKVDTIFINGDLIDFHKISRFLTDPRKRSVAQELESVRLFLTVLRKNFPKAAIYWLKGNHDVRLEHYLTAKAPELLGVDDFELKSLLRLAEFGVTIIDDKRLVKIGKLAVTHGHLLLRGVFAPVNSARGVFIKALQSTLIGHTHKISTHQQSNMDGKPFVTYSTGCLCQLKPDYNPLVAGYMHGFAHVEVEKSGNYRVRNIQIIDGEIF